MDVKYINPFIQAIKKVFETMVHTQVKVGKPALKNDGTASADVSGIIGFSGDAAGCVVLSFPKEVAVKAVTKFAGMPIEANHPDFADAVGELANMVAGSAKAEFEGMKISISLPSVVMGQDHTVSSSRVYPRIVIPCQCDLGEIFVEVGMELNPAGKPKQQLANAGAQ